MGYTHSFLDCKSVSLFYEYELTFQFSLLDNVSVVRQRQFRSGAISPVQGSSRDLGLENDNKIGETSGRDMLGDEELPSASELMNTILKTTCSQPGSTTPSRATSATPSRATSATPSPDSPTPSRATPTTSRAAGEPRKHSRKSHRENSQFSPGSALAFVRETQAYHTARAETDRRRLELEESRFRLEQSSERRAEQRVQQEYQRLELMREEHRSVTAIARDSHELELARLELARDRNEDLKRRTELDELDRLRTHKRLRAETITHTALQIQADKDNRYNEELKEASQRHILTLFAKAAELD